MQVNIHKSDTTSKSKSKKHPNRPRSVAARSHSQLSNMNQKSSFKADRVETENMYWDRFMINHSCSVNSENSPKKVYGKPKAHKKTLSHKYGQYSTFDKGKPKSRANNPNYDSIFVYQNKRKSSNLRAKSMNKEPEEVKFLIIIF